MGRLRAGGCHLTSLGMSTQIDEGQWTPSHWGGGSWVYTTREVPSAGWALVRCHLAPFHSHPASPPFLSPSPCGAGTDTEHKQTGASL